MPLSKKAATELITVFAGAVRAHEMKGAQPPEEWDEIIHNYREARSALAVRFHYVLDELERLKKENERLTKQRDAAEYQLSLKQETDRPSTEEAYLAGWQASGEGYNHEHEPQVFLTEAWRNERNTRLTTIGQYREGPLRFAERRLAEANALLDQVHQYVDSTNLGKLGESQVQVLIDDHQKKTQFMHDIRIAHNTGDPEVHQVIKDAGL